MLCRNSKRNFHKVNFQYLFCHFDQREKSFLFISRIPPLGRNGIFTHANHIFSQKIYTILKKNLKKLFLAFTLIVGTSAITTAQDCGVKRWDVKTLSDFDTTYIDFTHVVNSTVHDQINLPKPIGQNTFRMKLEDTVYSIECYIIAFKKETDDKDIHVVIQDPVTKETMVAEVISWECMSVKKTSRVQQFKDLDEWFAKYIGIPKTKFTYLSKPKLIRLTGVGFFDFFHGQKGMSPNGREIHPVLSIELVTQ